VIDEASVPDIQPGQIARVQLNLSPGVILSGVVRNVAEVKADEVSPDQLDKTSLKSKSRHKGSLYQARITLDSDSKPLLFQGLGKARIKVQPRSVGRRLLDLVRQTFSLGL
jgi:multidrug resistance efflux pump